MTDFQRGYPEACCGEIHSLFAGPGCAALAVVASALDGPLDRVFAYVAGVLGAAGSKSDLIAIQLAVRGLGRVVAGFEGAGDHPEGLLERRVTLRTSPRA